MTTPEYLGAHISHTDIPIDSETSAAMKYLLSATGPIAFGPEHENNVPSIVVKQFSVQSSVIMAIYPKFGKPWIFGLHQCAYARAWTEKELNLFRDFGQHISASLTRLPLFKKERLLSGRFQSQAPETSLSLCFRSRFFLSATEYNQPPICDRFLDGFLPEFQAS